MSVAKSERFEGFVLVATLWVLAGLALLAAYIDRMVAADVERAGLYRQSIQDEVDRRGTEATLLYLLSTGRMSYRGLVLEDKQQFLESFEDSLPPGDGEVTMAGEPYRGLGRMKFSLQDERGLASVNTPTSPTLRSVLQRAGVAPADVELIVPRLRDYIDLDHQITLNGAEHFDYAQSGMTAPANWYLAGPMELKRVLGVETLLSPAQWRRLSPLLSTRIAGIFNFNTMHPQVVAAVLELDQDGLREVLAARDDRPITRLSQIAMLTGKYPAIDEESIVMYPSPYVRIAIWPEGGARQWVAGFSLTPGSVTPWRTEYRYSELVLDDGIQAAQRAATPLF